MRGNGFKSLLFVLFITLFGCGREPTPEEQAEFLPYFHRFVEQAKVYGRDVDSDPVPMYFGDLGPTRVGVCEERWFQSSRIYIDRRAWAHTPEPGREALIFHELGHCVLKREHKDTVMTVRLESGARQVPESIMNTSGVHASTYTVLKNYFLTELFGAR